MKIEIKSLRKQDDVAVELIKVRNKEVEVIRDKKETYQKWRKLNGEHQELSRLKNELIDRLKMIKTKLRLK